jgi:hypothetical protein
MLYTQKVLAELRRKRALFTGYQRRHGEHLAAYRAALASLGARYPSATVLAAAQDRIAAKDGGRERPTGARPTPEYDRWCQSAMGDVPRMRFGPTFAHHEEARAWAETLRGVTTIAVDGSQLLPWKDASLPVALVQAGLFENPHQPPAPYVKDVAVELLGPEDLTGDESDALDARSDDMLGYSEQMVHLRRFELEVETLASRMEQHAGKRDGHASIGDEGSVVAFYDGSLLVSFALKMPPRYRERYVAAVQRLRQASLACRIPLVAYVDTSYARDIVTLLRALSGDDPLVDPRGVYDALLWRDLAWGERSPAFLVARGDLPRFPGEGTEEGVGFVYLRSALDRPPARLEFPYWVLDAGLLDRVMDVVRAEVIAGNGYPYCIEAADAVAVISSIDRARFYALFQEYAEREGIAFTFSRKAASKGRRRV